MSFQKGHKKFGGRKKGVGNKTNVEIRMRIHNILEDNWSTLEEDLKELPRKDRINTIIKLMDFVVPKLNKLDINEGPSIDSLISMNNKERERRIQILQEKLGIEP